ncbi:MAG: zinc ABC transporter substrate-binding protein [Phycisphaerae bacterium]|jgi:manganese/zinc/iron transport system substrate-binding protein|nr:zinc ABC transporter substrate-binding protein [Phycisphaerae bacterium]MCZ2399335.1 zinc ABC transporter substrate-binding protein [Phycisphaerae bacterium]NUQ48408.1 zinc ABC transporter substrate-binding protein [Phycisphaerae bacterium]
MNHPARLACAACLLAVGLPPALAPAGPPRKHQIVTTVGMVTDIVSQVAGDRAEVRGLVGSGIDPHLYKPTRNDVAALQGADAVFYSGLVLEGKMTDALVRLARGGKKVFAVTELLDEKYLLEPPEANGHYDPHVWMDVSAWSRAVDAVAGALSEFDPAGADVYRANAARYQEQLARLDAYVREVIASIPERQRVLITAHDAFNYFGRAYGVRVLGVQGISTESEAGLDDIKRLVDFIVDNDIRAVFVESSVAERNVRALIEGARARGKTVRIGGTLFSDAMGPPGRYEGTYIGMIDHNATTIARALGGKAPERGMDGKLNAAE